MQAKFLQIADFHLDSKFLGFFDLDKIAIRKKELEETFKKVIQFTNAVKDQEKLDFVLFAGDLFEQDCFSPQTIKSLIIYGLESLRPLPVFIVAGNHDPLIDGSPYLLYNWPDNVHIFPSDFEKFEVKKDVFIYGVSVTPGNFKNNILKDFKVKDPESLNIVLMHGAETGGGDIKVFGDCLPFSSEDAINSGADYFALGHYHNCRSVPYGSDLVKGFYSGSPEALSFKEMGERFVLKVELKKNNPPLVEKISFQHRTYKEIEIDCTGISSSESVLDLLKESQDKDGVCNIVLTGDVDPDIRLDMEELQDFIKTENLFFAANIKDKIRALYTDELVESSPLAKNYLKIFEDIEVKYPKEVLEVAKKLGLDAIFTKEIRGWNEI
ncbi:MAG: DNA repair exonuclease [Candidatus Saelkia tenebricola]|nr:DNA repair exonuclease [Candidatus Saelkia tenebricola]